MNYYNRYENDFDYIVDEIIEEHSNTSEDVDDIFRRKLDYYVSCNCCGKNMEIIDDMGGLYTNLKRYKDEYGDIDMEPGQAHFYAVIAFISIQELIREKRDEKMNEI